VGLVKFALIEGSFFRPAQEQLQRRIDRAVWDAPERLFEIGTDQLFEIGTDQLFEIGAHELFEIGAHQVDEVLGYFLRGERGATGLHHVLADVVFEDLGHEAVDAAADVGEEHEDVGAVSVAAEGALDGVDLTADALDAGEEFFVLTMSHFVLPRYLSF
jgi:hypothetical protein